MVRRKGRDAYLLITFDLVTQKIVSTDELVGPLESYRVKVDWNQFCKLVKGKSGDDPPEPPWTRIAFDDEEDDADRRRPWTRGEKNDVERPPEV